MATIAQVIVDATDRINRFGELDFQRWERVGDRWEWSAIENRAPTDPEKVNIIARTTALLQPAGAPLTVTTLDSIYAGILPAIAAGAAQPKILVVDYANLDGLKNDRTFDYPTGDHPEHIIFNLPIPFLLNMVIEQNYDKLILVVKNDKYPGGDIEKLIKYLELNTETRDGLKIKYYMRETIKEIKKRIIENRLQIKIVQINSFDVIMRETHPVPKTFRSFDDCTLIHLIRYLHNNGYTNYKFISRDMRLFDDFENERIKLLPYILKITSLNAEVVPAVAPPNYELKLNNSADFVINTISDLHYTTALIPADIVTYKTKRICTIREIQDLLVLHYFKPHQGRNHRIIPLINRGNATNNEFIDRVAQIFMNVTSEDVIADDRLNAKYIEYQDRGVVFKRNRDTRDIIKIINLSDILRRIRGGIPSYYGGDYKEKYLKYKAKYLALKDELR